MKNRLQEKQTSLKRMKAITSALLILAGVGLYASFYFDSPFFKAVSEAALVGGIADWFAVVALFKHPFNIPIPHTGIIPKSKNVIAKNLGVFIKEEFLNKDNLGQALENLQLKTLILDFISNKKLSFSLASLMQEFQSKLPKIFEKIQNEDLRLLDDINASKLIGGGLQSIKESSAYNEITEEIILHISNNASKIANYLVDRFKQDSYVKKGVSWIFSLDSKLASKIEDLTIKLKNPNAEERKELDILIDEWIEKLMSDPSIQKLINDKFRNILKTETNSKIIKVILDHITENELITKKFQSFVSEKLLAFANNDKKVKAVDRWIKRKIVNIIYDYSANISEFIERTIQAWDSQEISQKLELEVGKDLQYIRINGMLVGGLIGGIIFGIETLCQTFI